MKLGLLADYPHLIPAVAEMRWSEWGHPPEPEDPAWWLETTEREAGRDDLPVTFVAVDDSGDALGAVGLDHYDLDERRQVSPWVTGTIVDAGRRGTGVGTALMTSLEAWAAGRGIDLLWVGTEHAEPFYRRCGWRLVEVFTTDAGEQMTVLNKELPIKRRAT